jgi:hypothetical protein
MNAKTRRDVWFFIFEKLNHKILILKLVLILKLKIKSLLSSEGYGSYHRYK